MRALLLAMVLASAAFAGCVEPDGVAPASRPGTPDAPRPDGATPPPAEEPPSDPDGEPGDPEPNGTEEPDQPDVATPRDWPDLAAAKVRPGVQVVSPTGQCTSNFVFTSPDGADVYLGLAAHCVDDVDIGERLDIGGVARGTLAYSSWATMEEVEEEDRAARAYNDFALVLVDAGDRDLVHPAMRHFGGPTALAASDALATGDKVLSYGNSGLRMGLEPASWKEGYVVSGGAWSVTVLTATPGIPGDSGSGVLTRDGEALGILVTLTLAPLAGTNGVTTLDQALAYAKEHAGVDARLATWDLLDGGILPGV